MIVNNTTAGLLPKERKEKKGGRKGTPNPYFNKKIEERFTRNLSPSFELIVEFGHTISSSSVYYPTSPCIKQTIRKEERTTE